MSSDKLDRNALVEALSRDVRQQIAEAVLFFEGIAERLGINPTDMRCLNLLNNLGSMTAGRLAELTGLTTGAITGVIDRLEKVGYARREKDPADRRRVMIQLLQASRQDIEPFFESMGEEWSELCSHYSDQELALILDFVARTHPLNQRMIAKLRAGTASAKKARLKKANEG